MSGSRVEQTFIIGHMSDSLKLKHLLSEKVSSDNYTSISCKSSRSSYSEQYVRMTVPSQNKVKNRHV